MKTLHKTLLTFILLIAAICAFAQDNASVKTLINQGVALNDSGKYDAAIDKYKQALTLDSLNLRAKYELSYTLSRSGRAREAIPYLEKVAASNTYPEAYDLLASIYDDANDFEKSVAYYKMGLIAFPNYERLHFNLGVSYLRQKKYPEAEAESILAIKLDPKHASSQRVYALATYSQDKRGVSLLAWCSFSLLEPQTKRSEEAFRYVQKLLNYGIVRTGEKKVTINVNPKDMEGPNFLMPMSVLGATSDKTGLTRADSLTLELKSIFEISGNFAGKKADAFYKSYFSDYFKSLAASDNMPAFARFISIATYKEDNLQWFKDNDSKLSALDSWVATTKRRFE